MEENCPNKQFSIFFKSLDKVSLYLNFDERSRNEEMGKPRLLRIK